MINPFALVAEYTGTEQSAWKCVDTDHAKAHNGLHFWNEDEQKMVYVIHDLKTNQWTASLIDPD